VGQKPEAIRRLSLELVTSALPGLNLPKTLIQLKRGLGFLATIGFQLPPFVGLFRAPWSEIIKRFSGGIAGHGGPAECSLWFSGANRRGPGPRTALGIFVRNSGRRRLQTTSRAKMEDLSHVEMNSGLRSQLVNCVFKYYRELKGLQVES